MIARQILLFAGVFAMLATGCDRRSEPDDPRSGAVDPDGRAEFVDAPVASSTQPTGTGLESRTGSPAGRDRKPLEEEVLKLTGRELTSGQTVSDEGGSPAMTRFPDGARLIYREGVPMTYVDSEGGKTAYTYAGGKLVRVVHPDGRVQDFPVPPSADP